MPQFSIVMPTFNRRDLLLEAMESVRSQPFDDYELLVADDGSTDDTMEMLAREAASAKWGGRLRFFHQDNAGSGAARNLALRHARGEYAVFLDSDDMMLPWSLTVLDEVIRKSNGPSLVIGSEGRFSSGAEFAALCREPLRLSQWANLYALGRLGPTGTLVAKTDLIKAAGGFVTERFVGEDADLMLRLGTAPNTVWIEAPYTYGYRGGQSGNQSSEPPAWARGAVAILRRFDAGIYPGEGEQRVKLRKMVAFNAAWATLHCMKARAFSTGIGLYLRTFGWQARAGQFDYLLKTPFRLVLCVFGLWPLRREHREGKL